MTTQKEQDELQEKAIPLMMGGALVTLVAFVIAAVAVTKQRSSTVVWMAPLFLAGAMVFAYGTWFALPIQREGRDLKKARTVGAAGVAALAIATGLVLGHVVFPGDVFLLIVLYGASAVGLILTGGWLKRAAGS